MKIELLSFNYICFAMLLTTDKSYVRSHMEFFYCCGFVFVFFSSVKFQAESFSQAAFLGGFFKSEQFSVGDVLQSPFRFHSPPNVQIFNSTTSKTCFRDNTHRFL